MSHLLTILQLHRGKARAITGKELAQVMGEPDDSPGKDSPWLCDPRDNTPLPRGCQTPLGALQAA